MQGGSIPLSTLKSMRDARAKNVFFGLVNAIFLSSHTDKKITDPAFNLLAERFLDDANSYIEQARTR